MKNYTLSNAEMKLLEEFRAADKKYLDIQKVFQDLPEHSPAYDATVAAYNAAFELRHTKAAVFAMCVSGSAGNI